MKQRKKNDDLSRSIYQDNTEFKSPFFQGSVGFTVKEYFPKNTKQYIIIILICLPIKLLPDIKCNDLITIFIKIDKSIAPK